MLSLGCIFMLVVSGFLSHAIGFACELGWWAGGPWWSGLLFHRVSVYVELEKAHLCGEADMALWDWERGSARWWASLGNKKIGSPEARMRVMYLGVPTAPQEPQPFLDEMFNCPRDTLVVIRGETGLLDTWPWGAPVWVALAPLLHWGHTPPPPGLLLGSRCNCALGPLPQGQHTHLCFSLHLLSPSPIESWLFPRRRSWE